MQLFIMPFFLITVTLMVPCFFVFTLIAESVFEKNFCMRAGCYGQGTKSDSYGKIVDALGRGIKLYNRKYIDVSY